jgi:hypothetical protein
VILFISLAYFSIKHNELFRVLGNECQKDAFGFLFQNMALNASVFRDINFCSKNVTSQIFILCRSNMV